MFSKSSSKFSVSWMNQSQVTKHCLKLHVWDVMFTSIWSGSPRWWIFPSQDATMKCTTFEQYFSTFHKCRRRRRLGLRRLQVDWWWTIDGFLFHFMMWYVKSRDSHSLWRVLKLKGKTRRTFVRTTKKNTWHWLISPLDSLALDLGFSFIFSSSSLTAPLHPFLSLSVFISF